MKPSYSPTRVTIDGHRGRPRFDDDGDAVLGALSFSPGASRPPLAFQRPSHVQLLLQGVLQALLSGVVVSIVLCPVMIGFTAMIFSHADFAPALPMLTKLIFASSMVHQLVITTLSPLPFAIGQVQDTGMIFLANMASSITTELGPSVPIEERIATVLVHLSISTMLVGVGLILTGKARLASLVQYLPTPVIGGYLAYVGFFMVKGGVTLTTGVNLATARGWLVLVSSSHSLMLLAPGLFGGAMLAILTTRFRHFAVFPCCILVLPASFFLVLWISRCTLEDARAAGFLEDNGTGVALVDVYSLFDFYHIHWSAMPGQLPTMLSMFVMIAFASSLDIASICMGTSSNMNYNAQLQTVGASNLVSGLTGGVTGSYIFSQTLFTSRFRPSTTAEARFPGITRLVGITLAACEFAIVVAPMSLMAVVPKFLFGAVMIFIGIDLLKTWLVGVYHKLLFAEYVTVVGTFCCLNVFGVQLGLASGITLAATSFLVEYTKAQDVRVVHKTSNVIRNAEQHALLYGANSLVADDDCASLRQQDAIVTVELQGHIFFGSATRIQNCVKSAIYVRPTLGTISNNEQPTEAGGLSERLPLLSSRQQRSAYTRDHHAATTPTLVNLHGQQCVDHDRRATRFAVLDFSRVSGVDATAARSCFLALKLAFSLGNVRAVYCGMRPSVEFLLRVNDVLPEGTDSSQDEPSHGECHVTTDLDLALDWCEQQLILSAAKQQSILSGQHLIISPLKSPALSLPQVFAAYLPGARKNDPETLHLLEELAQLFRMSEWNMQSHIFRMGENSNMLYVLLRGTVELMANASEATLSSDSPKSEHSATAPTLNETLQVTPTEIVGRVRPGCIFGDMDFMLQQPRLLDATSTACDTLTAAFTREDLTELRANRPALALLIHEILLRASYMTLTEKLHSLAI